MAVQFAYPWNVPRSAISSPYLTYEQQHRRDRMFAAFYHAKKVLSLQPDCVRLDVYRTAAVLEQNQGSQRANAFLINFCKKALPRLELVAKKYECAGINSKVSTAVLEVILILSKCNICRHAWLIWSPRYNRLPDMSRADVDLFAAADLLISFVVNLPTLMTADSASLKRCTPGIFVLALFPSNLTLSHHIGSGLKKNMSVRMKSHRLSPKCLTMGGGAVVCAVLPLRGANACQIAVGNVSKKKNTYASKNCVTDWREQKRRTREFLKGLDLEDEDGNRISLIEKYDGSVANPAIRRCELMTRIRGFENICNELGYVGEFYTLTAPSKYHATTKAGYRNSKWSGASPADTQNYLTGIWARIRAKLHREDVRIFGIRVAEPHHDGTPHWHMLMFMLPEDVEYVRSIVRKYAWKEDRHELKSDKSKKARFHAESIDPEKGSATGYVAKYISKNIDGYALDGETDDESGELLKETAPAVSAWAARWHIRQFQFIGGAPCRHCLP